MSPLLYLKVGILVVGMAGSAWAARSWTNAAWEASMLAAEQAHTKAMLRELEKSNAAAADLETERAKRKVVTRTVVKEVERIVASPGFDRVCFADDAVRAINSTISGEALSAPKPDSRMPAPKPLTGRSSLNRSAGLY